jgi:selenium metabolism protein YedF
MEVLAMEIKIDARGLACPKPVIETKKALDGIGEGNIITVVDNEVARDNVSKFAKSRNLHFSVSETNGAYEISIFKGSYAQGLEDIVQKRPDLANSVVVIGSEFMGQGSEELGRILMKGYLYALTEYEPYPKSVILLNSGVKLSTVNTAAIESLKKLSDLGTEIISCGTCLDYYHLKEMVMVGEISNMYTIVEKISEANNTITF